MNWITLAFGVALGLAACTGDPATDGAEGPETSGDGDGDGEDTETGDSESIPDAGPARGIHITEVEANQGTAILIGRNGEWVGPEERNAFMIRDRDTLVRLQHTVDENWIPREIVGVLTLRNPEGEIIAERTHTRFVDGPSDPKSLNTEFYFSILAEEAQPGLFYQVELLEVGDVDVSGLAEGLVVTPPDFELIGYEQTPLEMKVMFVPIHYTWIDPPTLVEPTEEDMIFVRDDLLQTNPLQTVTYELHEPYEYTNHITNLGQLLSPMSALRVNESADPNIYYHAIVDVNGPSVNMVAGIASLTGNTKDQGSQRVAATVWFKSNESPPAGSSGTIIHEIGHNQGLQHVYCPNAATEAAGPDPNYPHEGGKIGVYGFGIRNFRLYTPSAAHDYMTYCGNAWVSDWTWNKTYQRIRTLTSWDYEGAPAGASTRAANVPLLVGTVFPDGSEDWWVMMGPAPSLESLGADQRVALGHDGVVDELYASTTMLSDHASMVVTAPLTVPVEELGEIQAIARVDHRGRRYPVDLDAIHVAPGVQLLQ